MLMTLNYILTRPDETSKITKQTECVKNVKVTNNKMTNNFLLLNLDKTEILLIGPKKSTQNLLDHNLLDLQSKLWVLY